MLPSRSYLHLKGCSPTWGPGVQHRSVTHKSSRVTDGFWMQRLDWRVRDPDYNPRLLCTMCLPFSFTFISSNILLRPREAGSHVKHTRNVLRVSSPTSFGECFVWANSSQKMRRICVVLHTWEQSRALTCGALTCGGKSLSRLEEGQIRSKSLKRDEAQKTVATQLGEWWMGWD